MIRALVITFMLVAPAVHADPEPNDDEAPELDAPAPVPDDDLAGFWASVDALHESIAAMLADEPAVSEPGDDE